MDNIIKERMEALSVYEHNLLGRSFILAVTQESEKLIIALKEIERVASGEDQIQCDGDYNDSDGMKWIYDRIQDLSCKEKK